MSRNQKAEAGQEAEAVALALVQGTATITGIETGEGAGAGAGVEVEIDMTATGTIGGEERVAIGAEAAVQVQTVAEAAGERDMTTTMMIGAVGAGRMIVPRLLGVVLDLTGAHLLAELLPGMRNLKYATLMNALPGQEKLLHMERRIVLEVPLLVNLMLVNEREA